MFFHAADIKQVLSDNGVILKGALHPALRGDNPLYVAYIEPLNLKHPHRKCEVLMQKLLSNGIKSAITYSPIAHVTGTAAPDDGDEELRITVYPNGVK